MISWIIWKKTLPSYIRNLCSCEKKAWKKSQACTGFELLISAIPVQRSTSKLTSRWEQVVKLVRYKPVKGWWWNNEYMKIVYVNCGVKKYLQENHRSYIPNLCSCEEKACKKIQAWSRVRIPYVCTYVWIAIPFFHVDYSGC